MKSCLLEERHCCGEEWRGVMWWSGKDLNSCTWLGEKVWPWGGEKAEAEGGEKADAEGGEKVLGTGCGKEAGMDCCRWCTTCAWWGAWVRPSVL